MERMETDLWKLMSEVFKCAPFDLVQVRNIAQQVCLFFSPAPCCLQLLTAVNILNNLGIIHSDIKPEVLFALHLLIRLQNILVVNAQDKFLQIKVNHL